MKLAIPYPANKPEIQALADEYNITYDPEKGRKFEDLLSFLQNHQEKRINLEFAQDEIDIEHVILFNQAHPQLYIRMREPHIGIYNLKFKEKDIKFFFDYYMPAYSFRLLEQMCELGVSDVYIADDLCYSLDKTRTLCNKYGVQIRMILNRIPSLMYAKGSNIRSPWFIPETVDQLAEYVDVAEFDTTSLTKLKTYYKMWFEKKKWRENVDFINLDLEIPIPNDSLIPNFTIFKMNCGYRCAYGSPCNKCQQFYEMAQDLHSKGFEYVLPTEKEREDE